MPLPDTVKIPPLARKVARQDDPGFKKEEDKMINKELLDILACPACKADVELKDDKIRCTKCMRAYPIKDGIPIMLIEASEGGIKE